LETIGEGSIRNTLDPRRETGRITGCFSIHGRFRLLSQSVTGRPQYRYHIDRAEVVWDESSNPVLKSTSFEVGLVLRLFPTKSCWITTFSSLVSLIPRFVYLSLRVSICSHVLSYAEPFIYEMYLPVSSTCSLFAEEYVPFSLLSFYLVLASCSHYATRNTACSLVAEDSFSLPYARIENVAVFYQKTKFPASSSQKGA
jgi:hypothetical protein